LAYAITKFIEQPAMKLIRATYKQRNLNIGLKPVNNEIVNLSRGAEVLYADNLMTRSSPKDELSEERSVL